MPPTFEYSTNDAQKIILLSKRPEIQEEVISLADPVQKQPMVKPEKPADTKKTSVLVAFVGPRQITKGVPLVPEAELLTTFIGPLPNTNQGSLPIEALASTQQSETSQTAPDPEIDVISSQTEKNTNIETMLDHNDKVVSTTAISTCFQLQKVEYKQEILNQAVNQSDYLLSFSNQEVPYISNYLVLTLPADSFLQAKKLQEAIKQQGISDLWLFEQGNFKWRISLGLFSSSEKAGFAKQHYAKQIIQPLTVVPSFQTHAVTQVTISAQHEEVISTFEQQFSHYIDKKVDCLLAEQ